MLILTTIYSYTYMKKEGQLQFAAVLLPVDLRGVEPLSEDFRDKLSTGLAKNMVFPSGVPFLLEAIG